MSDQMAPVLQSMQDYIEHHYLDEMMDEIEAVIDMEHRQHLNLGLEQQDDEVLRCVKLAFDRSEGKIVRSAFWRKDRINLRADMKIRIKVAACADGKILHYVIRYICCTADFVLGNGIRRIGSVTDVTMGGLPERRMPKLSKFLVPVLSYEEMEVLVLEMLGKYLGKDATQKYQHDGATRLAHAMGLNITNVSLYRNHYTSAMLFMKEGTVRVTESGNTGSATDDEAWHPFALQKACLLACGIIPMKGHNLKEVLERLGGGFVMHSEVTNVPKGSGLGTSSILSAACVKAVFEFMGIGYTEEDLYSHVLAMEQIMSTGGGWQDQVGGVTPGLKYITSMPGIDQKLKVVHVEIPEEAKKELDERFCLIYTGQRRLARNLLRDVIGRYAGNEPDSVFALEEIQKVAALMRFELERGNVDGFAKLLDYHWELSKKVDAGSSNTLIEQIFSSIEEMIDGRLVCGAGGGGFLQVVLKKGVTKKQVAERLHEVFMDSLVDVADCKLLWE